MKPFLYFAFILLSVSTYAQSKIEGIGKFKIGKTKISVVNDLTKELKSSLEVFNSESQIRRLSRNQIVEIKRNTDAKLNYLSPDNAPYCPSLRVFYINTYKISGIDVQSIYLFFLGDSLVKFSSKGSIELTDAMNLKYGRSHIGVLDARSPCDPNNKGYINTWGDEEIVAESTSMIRYTENCKKVPLFDFHIYQKKDVDQMRLCEETEQDRIKKLDEKAMLKKLKDF